MPRPALATLASVAGARCGCAPSVVGMTVEPPAEGDKAPRRRDWGRDWLHEVEVSRLTTKVASLEERVKVATARADSYASSRFKAVQTSLRLQNIVRVAAGLPEAIVVVSMSHTEQLLVNIMTELHQLRERVAALEPLASRTAAAEHELEAARKAIRTERKSIGAREGHLGRRLLAADETAARVSAEFRAKIARLEDERAEQEAWAKRRIGELDAAARMVAAEHTKALRQVEAEARRAEQQAVREAKGDTAASLERARARISTLEAALEKAKAAPAAVPVAAVARGAAPREPLLAVLATGARSVTSHRARLAGWAAGKGADVEAARALAVVVRDEAATPEARMRAQTALAGLLGGVR